MKILTWLKDNINLVSFVTGTAFIIAGKADIGQIIINQGGAL